MLSLTQAPAGWSYRSAFARVGLGLLVSLVLFLGLLNWSSIVSVQIDRLDGRTAKNIGEDYVVFYTSGRFILEGRGSELYDVNAVAAYEHDLMGRAVGGSGVLPYLNPPFVALLFAPFALLPLGLFSGVMFTLEVAMVVAGGQMLVRLVKPASGGLHFLLWLFYLTSFSTLWLVLEQQLSMLLFFGWFGFASFQTRGKEGWSGATLALTLIKPHVAILPAAVLLWNRRWRALRSFSLMAAALVLVSIAIAGPGVLRDYPRFLLESGRREGVNTSTMFGWNGLLATLTGDATPSMALLGPLTLATMAVAFFTWRGDAAGRPKQAHLTVGLALTASLLISPHLHMQDLVLLNLALAYGVAHSIAALGRVGVWGALAVLVWFTELYGLRLQDSFGLPVVTPVIVVVLAIFVAVLRRAREEGTTATCLRGDLYVAGRGRKGPGDDEARRIALAGHAQRARDHERDVLHQPQALPGEGGAAARGRSHIQT